MRTLHRFPRFTGMPLTLLVSLLFLTEISFAGTIVVGYAPNGTGGPVGDSVTTFDFATGQQIASFMTDGGLCKCGRGLEVVGNTVYYTDLSGSQGIHLAPYNQGLGGHDFQLFPNPRPGFGIQDIDYSNGALYVMTGYSNGLPIVYALSQTDGHVISSVSIQSHPGTGADGFTVLPNGDFLINDNDAVATYRGYDPTTGNPTGLVITLPALGGLATGVDYNPTDNSLYFFGFFGSGPALARTTLTGTFLGSAPISMVFEDISVVVPEPSSLMLYIVGISGLILLRRRVRLKGGAG
jgi:hypothetical protein